MEKTLERLQRITHDCRGDMHEPDEQGLEARLVGTNFDNAFGDTIDIERIKMGFQEMVVVFTRWEKGGVTSETFNLATLIALAKKAQL